MEIGMRCAEVQGLGYGMTPEIDMRWLRWRRLSRTLTAPRQMYALQRLRWTTNPHGYSLQQFERTRSIFIHIPKACGVSIARSLYGNLACGHRSMREYELAFCPRFLSCCYIFTFVRNPWDRLFSAYRFLRGGGMNAADRDWANRYAPYLDSFENFVERGLADPAFARAVHIKPQIKFLLSAAGRIFPLSYIGFYENLASDFAVVTRQVLRQPSQLSHDNKTGGVEHDYRTAYTDRMKEIVARFYADDIALLGYDFDGLALPNQIARRDEGKLFA